MGAPGKESNGAFRVVLERMDLSTASKAGASTLKSKSTATSVLRYFRRFLMRRHTVLGRLLWLCVLSRRVGLALLGGMRRSRFGRMRVMPWDVGMRDRGFGDRGRPDQRNRDHRQLPDHVIMF